KAPWRSAPHPQPPAARRSLHPFPTRRSSDLAAVTASWLFALWDGGGNVGPFLCLAEQLLDRGDRVTAVATGSLAERLGALGVDRSEEHTSALRSRENLVCRLLLEKQNGTMRT